MARFRRPLIEISLERSRALTYIMKQSTLQRKGSEDCGEFSCLRRESPGICK